MPRIITVRRPGPGPGWKRLLGFAAGIAAGIVAVTALAQGGAWAVMSVSTPQPVSAVRQVGTDVFVASGGSWFLATACGDEVCLQRRRPPNLATARDGIPDGTTAEAGGRGIVRAWYVEPTTRYDHGILGDQIEGGGLAIVDDAGRRQLATLDDGHVFEDLTPGIADIDGDGLNDVVTIRSGIAAGSAIAVYGIASGMLHEIAATPEIGQTHRWLNIAGIADFTGDGMLDIAIVKTPHIGGRLELWSMAGGELHLVAAADGFSNHAIGTTELGLSAVADIDGDGIADLALPDNSRTALRLVTFVGGTAREIGRAELPAPIVTAVAVLDSGDGPIFLAGLLDGRLVAVSH